MTELEDTSPLPLRIFFAVKLLADSPVQKISANFFLKGSLKCQNIRTPDRTILFAPSLHISYIESAKLSSLYYLVIFIKLVVKLGPPRLVQRIMHKATRSD